MLNCAKKHRHSSVKFSEAQVKRLLASTRSVTVVAGLLGTTVKRLSKYINGKKMRLWWKPMRTKWARNNAAARTSRWRTRKLKRGNDIPRDTWAGADTR